MGLIKALSEKYAHNDAQKVWYERQEKCGRCASDCPRPGVVVCPDGFSFTEGMCGKCGKKSTLCG